MTFVTGVKSQMPWDALRGGIIRQVIRELGFQDYGSMRKDEMIDYLHTVETSGLEKALALQRKRRAAQPTHTPVKRMRKEEDSPSKMLTRKNSRRTLGSDTQDASKQAGSSHFTFDCVLLDRAPTLSTKRKATEPESYPPISDREESPEIAFHSLSSEIPPSSLPSEADIAPTSEIAEEELLLPSSDASEEALLRSADLLFGPPNKSVKTYAKRKVGRPRKSLG